MSKRSIPALPCLAFAFAFAFAAPSPAALSGTQGCHPSGGRSGGAAQVAAAIDELRPLLSKEQLSQFERPLDYANATHWSNLPIGLVPRTTLRLGDLDAKQAAAARRVFVAALSACGLALMDDVRRADDFLVPFDKRPIGWGAGNY